MLMTLCICLGIYLSSNWFLLKPTFSQTLRKRFELLMAQQANMFALLMEMFFLSDVNDTIYLLGNLSFFKTHVNCLC